jgi:hypothetical protein
MTQPILTAEEILAWNETTATGWRKLLTNHPELLTQPCDIAGTKTVGELLQHIVAVELRYAERLASLPVSYAALPFDSVESIYATHDRAISIFQKIFASDIDWNESIEFPTRSVGKLRSTRKPSSSTRSCMAYVIMHNSPVSSANMASNPNGSWITSS